MIDTSPVNLDICFQDLFLLGSKRNKQSFLASQILVIYFGCSIVNLTIFCQLEYFQGFNIASFHFKLKFYFFSTSDLFQQKIRIKEAKVSKI